MKILYITRAYGEHGGGMERLSYELVDVLRKKAEIQMVVLRFKGSRLLSPFYNLLAAPAALAYGAKADVVYLGDPMLSGVGWLVKKLLRKPVAVNVHGLDISYGNRWYKSYLNSYGSNFDLYLTISQKVYDMASDLVGQNRCKVVTPGVVDRYYNPIYNRAALAKVTNLNVNDKVILFTCGRLVKRKGHVWFIANVLPKLPNNVVYVIAGEGSEQDRIERVMKLNGLTGQVLLLGRVGEQDLKILYNTVDAFIQPNVQVENDVEGFGMVLLEAALCRRTVFAADIDGIPSAIHPGKNGILLPAENSQVWVKTLTEYANAPLVSAAARNYTLENFTWDKKIDEIIGHLSALSRAWRGSA